MGRNNLVGAWGESVAARYLADKNYTLIGAGYRCKFGEIDLIVTNKKYIVFVEVKLRKSDKFAQAAEFVDYYKQNRLRTTASMYLAKNPTKLQPRFDVIEIYAPDGYETADPVIHHLEGAFE